MVLSTKNEKFSPVGQPSKNTLNLSAQVMTFPNPKYRVLLLDTKLSNPNHYICLCVEQALTNDHRVEKVIRAQAKDAIPLALSANCNLFIAFDGEQIDDFLCSRLTQICGKSVVWFTEDPYELETNKSKSKLFDLCFTNDEACKSAYGEKGRHLPLAAAKPFHYFKISPDPELLYDLFFVGTAWPNRVDFFKTLLKKFPDLKIKLALPTNQHLPKFDLGLPTSAYNWRTPNRELCRMASKSRITLTINRSFSASGDRHSALTPGPRLFETALAGGFQLVENVPSPANPYFDIMSELEVFSNHSECLEKIGHFLSHPEKRAAVAEAAQKRAIRDHQYSNRISQLLGEVEKIPTKTHIAASDSTQKPRILIVTHNVITPGGEFGGVEVYQKIICDSLKGKFEFFFYYPDRKDPHQLRYLLADINGLIIKEVTYSSSVNENLLSHTEMESSFSQIIAEFGFSIVHFHHLILHPLSLPFIAKSLGCQTVYTLHDFYLVCKRFNLLNVETRYCDISNKSTKTCTICLAEAEHLNAGSQMRRRAFVGRLVEEIDLIISNTLGTFEITKKIYPQIDSKKVQIFSAPIRAITRPTKVSYKKGDTLKIAIQGGLTANKGRRFVIHLMELLQGYNVEFYVFGKIFPADQNHIKVMNLSKVHLVGHYKNDEIETLLKDIHISLHFSIWPETFCMALSEAWSMGVVPIAFNIGALGERITNGENGYLLPVGDAVPAFELILDLLNNPEKLNAIAEKIFKMATDGPNTAVAASDQAYTSLLSASNHFGPSNFKPRQMTLVDFHRSPALTQWTQSRADMPIPTSQSLDRAAEIIRQERPLFLKSAALLLLFFHNLRSVGLKRTLWVTYKFIRVRIGPASTRRERT